MNSAGMKALLGTALIAFSMAVSATAITGRLDDAGNPALVGSDLGAPGFVDTATIANNVALYDFTLTDAGTVTLQSAGFATGGADLYFSLFAGPGTAATFVDSNFAQAFSTGGDFLWSAPLEAGTYRLALGTFANMSFAENFGSGTLADGFVGLGQAGSLGDASYRFVLTTPTPVPSVPEPATAWLLCIGLVAYGTAMRVQASTLSKAAPETPPRRPRLTCRLNHPWRNACPQLRRHERS